MKLIHRSSIMLLAILFFLIYAVPHVRALCLGPEVASYNKLASQGNAKGFFLLGVCYQTGADGFPKDFNKALQLYTKLSGAGHIGGQHNLATMYLNGQGVPKDVQRAVNMFLKVAKQGSVKAQNLVGFMYLTGQNLPQDYQEAVKWFTKAAQQNNPTAQNALGFMYSNGYGVTQDFSIAVTWYKKAALQGNKYSQHNLGWLYFTGHGIEQDYIEAWKWILIAENNGHVIDGAKASLKRRMTPSQISDGQSLAKIFIKERGKL
jgi:TPR repeat protein